MADRRIYMYRLYIDSPITISLPKESEILSVINVGDNVCLYAIVDTVTMETEEYSIQCYDGSYGTSRTIRHDNSYKFLGTVSLFDGSKIIHVFYKKL